MGGLRAEESGFRIQGSGGRERGGREGGGGHLARSCCFQMMRSRGSRQRMPETCPFAFNTCLRPSRCCRTICARV